MNKKLGDIKLWQLLPEGLQLDDVKPLFNAIQLELQRVELGIKSIYISGSAQDLSGDIVDQLAKDRGTIGYEQSLILNQRRALVDSSYLRSRQAGTPGAVKSAVEALGFETEIVSWHEDSSNNQPYTFIVRISNQGSSLSSQDQTDVTRAVIANKNLRSHLLKIVFVASLPLKINYGGYIKVGLTTKVDPLLNFGQEIPLNSNNGGYIKSGSQVKLNPLATGFVGLENKTGFFVTESGKKVGLENG